MGVGKGKKGRKEDKKATKKAAEIAKIPKIPKPPREPNPAKIAKKAAIRERREERKINPIGCDPVAFPTPMGRLRPFTHQHAKWPALMKKHIGVLESHVKNLDRIMMSMRSDFQKMPDTDEKLDYELGERGNWRAICSMMDRAREILGQAKEGAYGVVSTT